MSSRNRIDVVNVDKQPKCICKPFWPLIVVSFCNTFDSLYSQVTSPRDAKSGSGGSKGGAACRAPMTHRAVSDLKAFQHSGPVHCRQGQHCITCIGRQLMTLYR